MVVGCPFKRTFWMDIMNILDLSEQFQQPDSIWSALICFRTMDNSITVHSDTLAALGSGLATLWKYRWKCKIGHIPWH
ncbi:hypothetical protein G6F56_008717 [Rhizopus delemar]|nr:hypothetical protein G6F56_008717 [Rhizopus delemar]